jgi:hypothetical protein
LYAEATVLRQRLDDRRHLARRGHAARRVGLVAQQLAHRLVEQLEALARRTRDVDQPVELRRGKRRRRQAHREAGECGVQGAVGDLRQAGEAVQFLRRLRARNRRFEILRQDAFSLADCRRIRPRQY